MKKSVQSRKWEKIVGEENNGSIIGRNIRCYIVSDASSFICYLLTCVREIYKTDRRKEIRINKMGENRRDKTNKREIKKTGKEEIKRVQTEKM
jgi:hypothetical protein